MLTPLFSQAANLASVVVAAVGIVVVVFVFLAIWAARYTKVSPNQVLVVSGRRHQQQAPDGTVLMRGFRIVKGGGTFVLPVVEKADVLSLELLTIDVRVADASLNQGGPVQVSASAQIKIKGDDISIATAIELFLSGGAEQIKKVTTQMLQNHLRSVLGMMTLEQCRNRSALGAKLQEVAGADIEKMGLAMLSFTITDFRPNGSTAEPPLVAAARS